MAMQMVLFVCLGNIVRSPLAEALFNSLAAERGLDDKFAADSAGIGAWHVGEPPDERMRAVAAKHGVHYWHSARQVDRQMVADADLIVVMDEDNYADLRALFPNEALPEKIRHLRQFDPEAKGDLSVPDPYYGNEKAFENVYRIIRRSVEGLLDALERGELPPPIHG